MRSRRRQRGFTLVEMMIALVLFSFAIAGVLSVAVSMASGFHEQRQAISVETAVRGPMDYLSDAIRLSSPSVPSGQIADGYTCTVGAITVVDGGAAGPDQMDVTYASGSSISSLTVLYAGGATLTINNDSTPSQASQIFPGDTLLISNFTQGTLVHVVSVVPAGLTATVNITAPTCGPSLPAGGYLSGALVIRVLRARFSISTLADGINLVPCLMVDPDADGAFYAAEPLAEDIEDMQISIGADANGDGVLDPTEFGFSSTNPLAAVGPIRAVRITLISRSADVLVAGGTSVGFRPAAENRSAGVGDGYRRRVLTSTVEVRNLVGSP